MISLDHRTRAITVVRFIIDYRKRCRPTDYLESQAWALVMKMVAANEHDLAVYLGIELECQDQAPILVNYAPGYRWSLPDDGD